MVNSMISGAQSIEEAAPESSFLTTPLAWLQRVRTTVRHGIPKAPQRSKFLHMLDGELGLALCFRVYVYV